MYVRNLSSSVYQFMSYCGTKEKGNKKLATMLKQYWRSYCKQKIYTVMLNLLVRVVSNTKLKTKLKTHLFSSSFHY